MYPNPPSSAERVQTFEFHHTPPFLIVFAFPTSVSSGAIHASASWRDHPSGRGSTGDGDFETGDLLLYSHRCKIRDLDRTCERAMAIGRPTHD